MLFSFTGRINRAPFWLAGTAANIVTGLIVLGIAFATRRIVLAVPVLLALNWITFALVIKRLHDRDISGWWVLLFWFAAPILAATGSILPAIGERVGSAAGFVLGLIGVGITSWGLVEVGFLRGTPGQNSYGPDPLAGRGSA